MRWRDRILQAHAEQLGAARPSLQQDHQQGGVAAGLEVLAATDGEQRGSCGSISTGTG